MYYRSFSFFYAFLPSPLQLVVGAVIDSGSHLIAIAIPKETAVSNCHTAAAIYGGFIGLSLIMLIAGKIRARKAPGSQQSLLTAPKHD